MLILYLSVACRKGHQGIQSIPNILSNSLQRSLRSHVLLVNQIACIPRYFCYRPPLVLIILTEVYIYFGCFHFQLHICIPPPLNF